MICADGLLQTKPYALPIHGCVDGYLHKVLWPKVSRTNNDPIVPAYLLLRQRRKWDFARNIFKQTVVY